MKKTVLTIAVVAIAGLMMAEDASAQAQMIGGDPGAGRRGPYPARVKLLRNALNDRVHPKPFFAHSRPGIDAARTHQWNSDQGMATSWHGGHYFPRFGAPTALVVPPTAAYQSVYSWGVGQTRSIPIYHQFGQGGMTVGGSGGMGFSAPPYWPSSTSQFGIYPVRGPW